MSIRNRNVGGTEAVGYIPLHLHGWEQINAGNTDYALLAATADIGSGGVFGADSSTARRIRVNAATDKAATITWLSSQTKELVHHLQLPPDYDNTQPITFKMKANLGSGAGATTDFAMVYTVGFWIQGADGAYVLSVNGGGTTQSFATAFAAASPVIAQATGAGAIVTLSKSIVAPTTAAGKLASVPNALASITLAAGTHTTDASSVFATWVEYSKRG